MPIIMCHNRKCPHWDETDQPDNCSHPIYEMKDCSKAIIRKDSPVKSKNFYHEQLMSDECYCGESKTPKFSFCASCYHKLPIGMKADLWRKIGQGYENNYEEALKFLEACYGSI